jgi:hypothetical protein
MTNPEQLHVVGFGWRAEGIHLEVRDGMNRGATRELELTGTLRFKKLERKVCTGWYDFAQGAKQTCPDNTESVRKSQCEGCIEREGFTPWLRCDGRMIPELKPSVREYIDQPHFLYLACFGDDTVKVGMTSKERKHQRLWDQGPLAAFYIATAADGITVRQLEVEVSRLGYTEFMRRSRKLELLKSEMSADRASRRVRSSLDRIRGQLSEDDASLLFRDPELVPTPALATTARGHRDLDTIEPKAGEIIEGQLIGASGSVVVLDDGVRSALDLYHLIGHEVEFNPVGEVKKEARQIGLFG